jgi:hypothetical protein
MVVAASKLEKASVEQGLTRIQKAKDFDIYLTRREGLDDGQRAGLDAFLQDMFTSRYRGENIIGVQAMLGGICTHLTNIHPSHMVLTYKLDADSIKIGDMELVLDRPHDSIIVEPRAHIFPSVPKQFRNLVTIDRAEDLYRVEFPEYAAQPVGWNELQTKVKKLMGYWGA